MEKQVTNSWSSSLGGNEFSLSEAVGGVRGVIETLVPGIVFVVVFVVSGNLVWTVGSAAGLSVLFCAVRLMQRQPLTQALAGLLGVLIGVLWAFSSGKAENYFAWGLVTNAVYAALLVASIIFRHPAGVWALVLLWGLPKEWGRTGRRTTLYRRAEAVTWVWFGVFALRLAVQVPVYFAGEVAALGVLKLVMGLPLFGLGAWATWILLRNQRPQVSQQNESDPVASAPSPHRDGLVD